MKTCGILKPPSRWLGRQWQEAEASSQPAVTRSAVRVRVVDAGAARRLVYWGTTCEDVLPAASAGALSGVGRIVGRIVDIAGRNNQASAADGGFMDVEGTLPGWQESEASLITDTGLGRQQL